MAPRPTTVGFGLELRRTREGLGLTQAQLGAMLGVSNKTVCLWEQGHQQPGVRLLSHLFHALEVGDVRRLVLVELLGVRE